MATKRLRAAAVEAPAAVQISVEGDVTRFQLDGDQGEVLPLFYRRAEYRLPAYVVQAPMPTLTCRHLEKATIHLLQGHDEQALLAFRRAVASAIEPMTLIKVALACHTERHVEEAEAALRRALRYAGRDQRSESLVRSIAGHLGYGLE
jgi:tetratricopeptide (TPR) repeat protein